MLGLKKIKAICFDYYGTLVNAEEPFLKIKNWFSHFLEKQKSDVDINRFNMYFSKQRARYFTRVQFLNGYDTLEKSYIDTCKKYNVNPSISEFKLLLDDLFTNPLAFDDAFDVIKTLKQKYVVSVISNADNIYLHRNMIKNDFVFDYVFTSEDAGCNKPDIKIFEDALKELNIDAKDVLMTGDSVSEDIFPAKSLGFHTIWINRKNTDTISESITVHSLKEILQYL